MNPLQISILLVAIFCLVRGFADLRERRFAWSLIGFACGGLLLFTPIPIPQPYQVDVVPASSQ